MALIQMDDLTPFATIAPAKAMAMIEDAEAMAILAAPCLSELTDPAKVSAARAILRGAILRWNEAGTGALSQHTESAAIFSHSQTFDTRQPRKGMFWPSEIEQLQSICASPDTGKAFTVDTVSASSIHAPWCSLAFGALYCSCGADIAGFPLYGGE